LTAYVSSRRLGARYEQDFVTKGGCLYKMVQMVTDGLSH